MDHSALDGATKCKILVVDGTSSSVGEKIYAVRCQVIKYKHSKYENSSGPPLHVALKAKDENAAEELLRNGADPNDVDEILDNALHVAAEEGCRLPLFTRILKKITDVNARNEHGYTALMRAAARTVWIL